MIAFFVIPGEPQGKGRPRFSRAGKHVKTYTPDKTASYESLIRFEYERQCRDIRFLDKTPLKIMINAFFSIPKSTSRARRDAMLEHEIRPTRKPDADNILKVVCDALNGIAYNDDAQIVNAAVNKYYGDKPRVAVWLGEDVYSNRKET